MRKDTSFKLTTPPLIKSPEPELVKNCFVTKSYNPHIRLALCFAGIKSRTNSPSFQILVEYTLMSLVYVEPDTALILNIHIEPLIVEAVAISLPLATFTSE